jgi:hypothetical protein
MVLFIVLPREGERIEHRLSKNSLFLVVKEKQLDNFQAHMNIPGRTGCARLNLLLVPGAGVMPSLYTIRNGIIIRMG